MTWIAFLLQKKLHMLTVHGRTRKEMSKVPAHWDLIGEARNLRDRIASGTLIVGNGDVESRGQALELAERYSLDGIMVGRGIFHDPFLFAEQTPWPDYPREQRIALYQKHVGLFAETWQPGDRHIATLNKFCKVYISDFDGAKELRERLMNAGSAEELLELLAAA